MSEQGCQGNCFVDSKSSFDFALAILAAQARGNGKAEILHASERSHKVFTHICYLILSCNSREDSCLPVAHRKHGGRKEDQKIRSGKNLPLPS